MDNQDKICKAYANEKVKHGVATIILFHVGGNYEAYNSDALALAKLSQLSLQSVEGTIPIVQFPADKLEYFTNRLVEAGYPVCISEVRGASGQHILESL